MASKNAAYGYAADGENKPLGMFDQLNSEIITAWRNSSQIDTGCRRF
jgi:hypothetical protein